MIPSREEWVAICKRLKVWEINMGGWDAKPWRDLDVLLDREAGIIPTPDDEDEEDDGD